MPVSLDSMREQFFTALISDALDSLGYMDQALPSRIRPLDDDLVMVGRARTALFVDVYEQPKEDNPYELEIALVDGLNPGDIPVFGCGATGRIAPWGALLSTASQVRGAAGALMDGLVRDVRDIRAMKFPVFHGGIGPLDSKGRGKIVAIDVPVECAGVLIQSGDLIFGDADGCIVIPRAIEESAIAAALEKLKAERSTIDALRAGRRLAEVFAEFHTL
jgi:regulator of RNase E activity RraA